MKTSDTLFKLVRATAKISTGHRYGHIRSKLVKQGFSEILLYKAVADHCDENFIAPASMAKDMFEVLDGCGRKANFLNTSNIFPFLRGQFHHLRYGNTQLSEPKCPEQKGLFICNHCHLVCDKDIRSRQKTTPYTCRPCISVQVKERKIQAAKDAGVELPKTRPYKLKAKVTKPLTFDKPVEVLPEVVEPIIVNKEVIVEEKQAEQVLVTDQKSIKIVEVIADEKSASVTINCLPKELHLVLSALSKVTI